MSSKGAELFCESCGKVWEMSELGELAAKDGETEFAHIPDWYEWERSNVIKEVQDGTYSFEAKVRVESLPNDKRFIVFEERATLKHNMDGFNLTGSYKGNPYEINIPVPQLYSCHIEYNYMGRGDCIDLNTSEETLYLFPEQSDFAVTKISLATEELFNQTTRKPSSWYQ